MNLNKFTWAGKPPTGHHLDVLKDDKLIQKLMIDEKKCYLFGRNEQMNDFCIDHASCSRVHAALVYHKHLKKAFLVDLGSTHGTYIGSLRLEAHKPTQLHIDSTFHFGASTRNYILRERPTAGVRGNGLLDDLSINENGEGALLGLPESQTELDNLTEYNTAHNRRILMLGISDDTLRKQNSKRKRRSVTFNDEEIIINPEDIDPNVGRFRNLIQTTVVPAKRMRFESTNSMGIPHFSKPSLVYNPSMDHLKQPSTSIISHQLYQGLPDASSAEYSFNPNKHHHSMDMDVTQVALGSKLGLLLPNPAPDVTPVQQLTVEPKVTMPGPHTYEEHILDTSANNEPQKKKYAKEAWPGRKPLLSPI